MSLYFILLVLKQVNPNINDPYANMCVPDIVKILNVKVFNLMSRTNEKRIWTIWQFDNETRHIEWHEICKCKCRLDVNIGIMINAGVDAKN